MYVCVTVDPGSNVAVMVTTRDTKYVLTLNDQGLWFCRSRSGGQECIVEPG